jgi:hypothetical protein
LSAAGGRLATALIVTVLSGCQSPPLNEDQIAALDYGPRPQNHEKIVRDYLATQLNDPLYAVIELKAGPERLYQRNTLLRERQFGWAVCVTVNERDPRGVYTDPYPMVVYIRGGRVVAANGGALERAVGLGYAQAQCKQLGYDAP